MTHTQSALSLDGDGARPPVQEIIGLIGAKGSGKDAVYRLIAEQRPATRLAFADGVKEEVADAIGMPVAWVESHKAELRVLLQQWGTELRRDLFDRDYWVKALVRKLSHVKTPLVVVTDIRFANEAYALQERGARLIRVIRDTGELDAHCTEVWPHGSEAAKFAPEAVFNDGNLDDLRVKVGLLLG